MGSNDDRLLAGRSGAVFLIAIGVLTVTDTLLRGAGDLRGVNHGAAIAVGLVTVGIGLVVMALPWSRWSRRAPMIMPFIVVAIAIPLDRLVRFSTDPAADASYAMLAFSLLSWIGLTQPRWTAARFAPYLAAVLAVDAATLPGSVVAVSVPLVIVPLATILAEICSWVVAALTASREAELRHSRALALVATPFPVEEGRAAVEAAVVDRAQAVFGAGEVVLVLRPPDGPAPLVEGLSVRERVLVTTAMGGDQVVADDDDSVLVVPLSATPDPVGAVVIRRPRSTGGRLTHSLARLLGLQAGSALAGQHLIDALYNDTRRDPLTGVGNRRAALDDLDGLGPGGAIAIVDIDGFKAVNDSRGHGAGDDLLCRLADHLVAEVGSAGQVARLGGDEFLVVLPRNGPDPAEVMARVVRGWREDVAETSLSIGIATQAHGDRRAVMRQADRALYRAKAEGRDRVVVEPFSSIRG